MIVGSLPPVPWSASHTLNVTKRYVPILKPPSGLCTFSLFKLGYVSTIKNSKDSDFTLQYISQVKRDYTLEKLVSVSKSQVNCTQQNDYSCPADGHDHVVQTLSINSKSSGLFVDLYNSCPSSSFCFGMNLFKILSIVNHHSHHRTLG
eukprot:sb/3473725/